MPLFIRNPGPAEDKATPVDPGQSPSDVIFISDSDADLATLSQARAEMPDPPGLRLLNLAHLKHPMSVDLHLDNTATRSRLVIIRLAEGIGDWGYGINQYATRLRGAALPLALLPGDESVPDGTLRDLSTVSETDCDQLWTYLAQGGPENATNFLAYARALLDGGEKPAPPISMPRAGPYWPGDGATDLPTVKSNWSDGTQIVPIVFDRSLLHGVGLNPINRLCRSLLRQGLGPLPIYVTALGDSTAQAIVDDLFNIAPPDIILNTTTTTIGAHPDSRARNPLTGPSANRALVFHVVLATTSEEDWIQSPNGLNAQDIVANVLLPEIDGFVPTRAVSFREEAFFDDASECPITTYRAQGDRIECVARLTANWARLRKTPTPECKLALVLANGGGLDIPASALHVLNLLAQNGYEVGNIPAKSDQMTPSALADSSVILPLSDYLDHYATLPWSLREAVEARWGKPEQDPDFILPNILESDGAPETTGFKLAIHLRGNTVVGAYPVQDNLAMPPVPRHGYIAFYIWLRRVHDAHAIVLFGTQGTAETLSGKALALSDTCWPEAILGPTPYIRPIDVSDPRQAALARRRASAMVIGHLPPSRPRAKTDAGNSLLDALVWEYDTAAMVDPDRADLLHRDILRFCAKTGIDEQGALSGRNGSLTELTQAGSCDRFHIFGQSPQGQREADLLDALNRDQRENPDGQDAHWGESEIVGRIRPLLRACGPREETGLLTALKGQFVAPAPYGAPFCGRLNMLPTGRNLVPVDTGTMPSPTAWSLGWASSRRLIENHLQTHGDWPRSLQMTISRYACLRSGGGDIAQALALMGVKPQWNAANRFVPGVEIIPSTALRHPRVDVTLRISDVFRETFPQSVALYDDAARAIQQLDEPDDINTAAGHARSSNAEPRIFGSNPGAYADGTGQEDTLVNEITRVFRSCVDNPEWIAEIKRQGHKGAFEIAATVDYLLAFSAATGGVKNHHFDMTANAFLEDDNTRQFIEDHNEPTLREIAGHLQEAIDRGLWQPHSDSVRSRIAEILK